MGQYDSEMKMESGVVSASPLLMLTVFLVSKIKIASNTHDRLDRRDRCYVAHVTMFPSNITDT